MTIKEAAAYCRMTGETFKAMPELLRLIKQRFGRACVDRWELDKVLTEQ
jgi:hypothetical protein